MDQNEAPPATLVPVLCAHVPLIRKAVLVGHGFAACRPALLGQCAAVAGASRSIRSVRADDVSALR